MAYRLAYSVDFAARFRSLLAEAVEEGLGVRFSATFRELSERLMSDPHRVGEIEYRLHGGQTVHHVFRGPVNLYCAIYDEQQVVWLTRLDRCDLNE